MADLNSMEFKSGQDMASDRNMMPLGIIPRRMTREERIKAKEREQGQKEGKIAPDLDAQGKEINPHVPGFIADAPWYMSNDTGAKSSLSHQKYVSPTSCDSELIPSIDMVQPHMIDLEWTPLNGMPEVNELAPLRQNIAREPAKIVAP